jgi:hypothetical protein
LRACLDEERQQQSWRRYFGHGYKWILSRA